MHIYLIVLLHVGSYISGPFDTMDQCLAKARAQSHAICVHGETP